MSGRLRGEARAAPPFHDAQAFAALAGCRLQETTPYGRFVHIDDLIALPQLQRIPSFYFDSALEIAP
ncbi:hypothetical protein J3Q00_02725 [Pseudomonas sp. D2-3]